MTSASKKGIGLVEVIIAAAVMLAIVSILVTVNNMYLKVSSSTIKTVKAQMLFQEGIEAIRLIRDGGWTATIVNLTNNTTYYYAFDTSLNKWSATTTPQYVDGMERTFVVSNVYRNGTGDIANSGTLDEGTRQVVVKVEWRGYVSTSTVSMTTYINNIYKD